MINGIFFFLAFVAAFQSQSDPPKEEPLPSKYRVGVAVDQVFLPVTARSLEGGFVRGLEKKDFEVTEDGVVQEIMTFYSEAFPVHVVLLLDASRSTRLIQDQIHRAALKFVESLGPDDRVAVMAFHRQPNQVCNWTNNVAQIEAGLKSVQVSGATALYDALWAAYDLLEPIEGRKAIVVLTDGADTGSKISREQLLWRAENSPAMVYVISKLDQYWGEAIAARRLYLGRAEMIPEQLTDEYIAGNKQFLYAISGNSGGRLLDTATYPDLGEIYKLIADELRYQYYMSYVPKNMRRDGSWRELNVKVNQPGVLVSTKPGYRAPRSR
ncbi:MAG TPA: VWA domain-containing protein [Acidobacteriota bacterium]|nr:VWA domain-containing protein [Acidobacteriota bacterium]